MQKFKWKLVNVRTPDSTMTIWRLERSGPAGAPDMFYASVSRFRGEVERVTVKVEAPSIVYAQAEAARLFAQAQDYRGDMAFTGDDVAGLADAQLDLSPRCPVVTLHGDAGLTVAAVYFGVEEEIL